MKRIIKKIRHNKVSLLSLLVVGLLLISWMVYFLTTPAINKSDYLFTTAKYGSFISEVYSTGQLQAENSVSINVPSELSGREIRIYEIKITQMIEEGSVVDSGAYVASLDHSAVEEVLTSALTELEEKRRGYEDAKIDTNMTLSNLRDALINAKEALEEKQLILDQSKYESPAVKRQATLDLEKAVRNLEQEQRNYKIKKQQENYKITRALSEVSRAQSSVDEINQLFTSLDIKAPKPGMVIYSFDRLGNKIKVGSTVSRWSPTIAELPDLSTMISKTFINEVDISKIKIDQMVTVGVDAFPEKSFRGKVIEVANIGQVLPGGDSKVFEVTIKVFGSDKELRPAMTTSNVIKTFQTDSVICIPLDAVFQNDSVQYVYSFQRTVLKKIVELGSENENYVIVKRGVDKGEELFLNEPLGGAVLPWVGIDIYEDLKVKKAIEAENMKKKPNERKKSNREGRKRSSSNSGNVNRNSN